MDKDSSPPLKNKVAICGNSFTLSTDEVAHK